MSHNLTRYRTLVWAAALLLALCGSSFAQCSKDTVRGTWAWQSHGTAMMAVPGSPVPVPVPFASLGTMKIDYQGRYIAQGTLSAGGQVQSVEFPGLVQVNPDCTVDETYEIGPYRFADQLVILEQGNEMQLMPIQHPLGPVTGRAYFYRLSWAEPQCSREMLRGVYRGTAEGTLMVPLPEQPQPAPTPFSGLVTLSFGYGGTGGGGAAVSLGGSIAQVNFSGVPAEVGADCTVTVQRSGVLKGNPDQPVTSTVKYLILKQGSELIGMETANSLGLPVVIEHLKRVSVTPLAGQ